MKKFYFGISVFIFLSIASPMAQAQGQAIAIVKGTKEGSAIKGEVKFSDTTQGLKIEADFTNIPDAGKHGFHIHEFGSCENNGKAAGGHFNPEKVKHGLLIRDGSQSAHAGDLGNISINEDGSGSLSTILPGLSLSGEKNNIAGRAVILHAKEDDFGQPTGNAGSRIGCGTIIITGK